MRRRIGEATTKRLYVLRHRGIWVQVRCAYFRHGPGIIWFLHSWRCEFASAYWRVCHHRHPARRRAAMTSTNLRTPPDYKYSQPIARHRFRPLYFSVFIWKNATNSSEIQRFSMKVERTCDGWKATAEGGFKRRLCQKTHRNPEDQKEIFVKKCY